MDPAVLLENAPGEVPHRYSRRSTPIQGTSEDIPDPHGQACFECHRVSTFARCSRAFHNASAEGDGIPLPRKG
jgi:hypothetical protein